MSESTVTIPRERLVTALDRLLYTETSADLAATWLGELGEAQPLLVAINYPSLEGTCAAAMAQNGLDDYLGEYILQAWNNAQDDALARVAVQTQALRLVKLAPQACPAIIPLLCDALLLARTDYTQRHHLAAGTLTDALAAMGAPAAEVIAKRLAAVPLSDQTPQVAFLCDALAQMGAAGRCAKDALIRMLQARLSTVRAAAVHALGKVFAETNEKCVKDAVEQVAVHSDAENLRGLAWTALDYIAAPGGN